MKNILQTFPNSLISWLTNTLTFQYLALNLASFLRRVKIKDETKKQIPNSNFQTHHTENRLRGKAGGGGGWARWLLSTDSLLRAWTALGTALNGSWGALVIIPGGRLPFPTVSLKLLAPPPTLPPPWKLFHLLTGPLLAAWCCPLPGPRSWLVCLCILSFFLPPSPSLSLSALDHPPQLPFRLHPSLSFSPPSSLFFYSVPEPLDYILQHLPPPNPFPSVSTDLPPFFLFKLGCVVQSEAGYRERGWSLCRIRIFELGDFYFRSNFCEPKPFDRSIPPLARFQSSLTWGLTWYLEFRRKPLAPWGSKVSFPVPVEIRLSMERW